MTRKRAGTPTTVKRKELEERVASLEGALGGLAVLTLVFTAEGQLVRVISSHAQTVSGLKGAKIALQVAALQVDDMLMAAVDAAARRTALEAIPESSADKPE